MLRILIIEDERVNQEFLRLALKPYGECLAVGTGEAGLLEHRRAMDQARAYDVIFLDLMLPGISGLQDPGAPARGGGRIRGAGFGPCPGHRHHGAGR